MKVEQFTSLVRPIVTLALVAGLIYGFVAGKIGAEAFLGTVSVAIGFWFSQRQAEKAGGSQP